MSSGLPPPKGVNGMKGSCWLLVEVGGVELDPLLDALLERDLPPDELTLTLEYIAPSVCCTTAALAPPTSTTRTVRFAS